jgi:hypothetical protein
MPRSKRSTKFDITRYPTKRQMERAPKAGRSKPRASGIGGPTELHEDPPAILHGNARNEPTEYRTTRLGKIFLGDSLGLLRGRVADASVVHK